MAKKRKKAVKRKSRAVKVKRVTLPANAVVQVVVPPGAMPVVAADPVSRTIEIVPAPKRRSWWDKLFD